MIMSDTKQDTNIDELKDKYTLLLEPFYGEFLAPVFWEEDKKSKNFFAYVERGTKYLFKRDFLRRKYIDNQVVFKRDYFEEGAIIEQRCTYVHGSKEEITFQGLFVIHHIDNMIYGDEISQKQALEYFDCCELIPEKKEEKKTSLRVELGREIRKHIQAHGEEVVCDVLIGILNDYFPKAPNVPSETQN